MDKTEIKSLIKLLDDPDLDIFKAVRNKLSQLGSDVIPHLEKAWENSLDSLFQTRIEDIIHDIHQSHIKNKLKEWGNNSTHDLLEGATIISQFQYPDIKFEDLKKQIEEIKKDIWLEINDNLTALEKIKIVNHIFFDVHKFARSKANINSIQGFFINQVLDNKKGLPIALAIIYAVICQQLDIPVYGVALPKNFILCYRDKMQSAFEEELIEGVLFYINPFNKGIVFGKKEIEFFIKQQKLENKKAYFLPVSNKDTIINLVNEIVAFYENNAEKTKAEEYRSLLKILYF